MFQARDPHSGLSILVVDDNADTARSTGMLLEMLGHNVRTALNGQSAISLATEKMPDVALIDIALPGLSGHAVAEAIRKLESARRPLIVAITGYSDENVMRRAIQSGCDLFLIKPVDPQSLTDVLSRYQRNMADEEIQQAVAVDSCADQA